MDEMERKEIGKDEKNGEMENGKIGLGAKLRWQRLAYRRILVWVFGCAVLLLAALFFLLPRTSFELPRSPRELEDSLLRSVRKIQEMEVMNTRYGRAVQNYVTDNFPFRDSLVRLRSLLEYVSGIIEKNGVYLSGDDGFAEEVLVPDEEAKTRLFEELAAFSKTHADKGMWFLLVPDAVNICRSKVAVDAPIADQNAVMDDFFEGIRNAGLSPVDVRKILRAHADQYIFYRTDPQWTTLAAKLAFDKVVSSLGIYAGATEYTEHAYGGEGETFVGKLAALNGLRAGASDVVTVFRAEQEPSVVAYESPEGDGEGKKLASCYDEQYLGTPDALRVFFGGDYPLLRLTREGELSGRKLLVVKDSAANSLLPFLAQVFDEVVAVDPRLFSGSLDALLKKEGITDILFLFRANNLFSDSSMSGLLGQGLK